MHTLQCGLTVGLYSMHCGERADPGTLRGVRSAVLGVCWRRRPLLCTDGDASDALRRTACFGCLLRGVCWGLCIFIDLNLKTVSASATCGGYQQTSSACRQGCVSPPSFGRRAGLHLSLQFSERHRPLMLG